MTVTNSLPEVAAGQATVGAVMAMCGLTSLTGAPTDPGRPVLGACLVEGSTGSAAVEPGWLVVTDGRPLAGRSDPELRAFVRECADKAAVGLVIKTPGAWDELPSCLVDEAQHSHLPVLLLPGQATVSGFLRQVHETTGISDVGVLSRAMGLQTELIGALSSTNVESELIIRVANALGVSAMLFDHRHEPIAVHGEAPVFLIADRLDDAAEGEYRLDVGRWHVTFSHMQTGAQASTLALAWPQDHVTEIELLRSAQYAVEQLLRAHSRTIAAARMQDQLQRSQLLSELLEGVTDARLSRMSDGLVLLHFPREGTYQVHLMDGGRTSASDADSDVILNLIHDIAADLGVPALMGQVGATYVALHVASARFTEELVERLPEFAHGASSAFHDLTATPSAFRQGQTSLAASVRTGKFTAFHRVGFIDFILGHLPEEILKERSSDVLGDLQSNDIVMDTVIEYLRCGLDVQETARTMHLHPNSIRYRLTRAEDHLGRSINDPETITLLYLVLNERLRDLTGSS